MKVPYMLVVGDQEMADETVALRKRDGSRQNGLPVAELHRPGHGAHRHPVGGAVGIRDWRIAGIWSLSD